MSEISILVQDKLDYNIEGLKGLRDMFNYSNDRVEINGPRIGAMLAMHVNALEASCNELAECGVDKILVSIDDPRLHFSREEVKEMEARCRSIVWQNDQEQYYAFLRARNATRSFSINRSH